MPGFKTDLAVVASPLFLQHQPMGPHPENPLRLQVILDLLDEDPALKNLLRIEPRAACDLELQRVHARGLLQKLWQLQGKTGWCDPDTYYAPNTMAAALGAAGGTIDLALKIWKGEVKRGFSLVRPPGHHATTTHEMGFCFFNNIALAAAAILDESPQARLAIVDFDLHHGNGTQDAFYQNPNVLFISSHRFPFYPGTGDLNEVGELRGKGTNLNFPIGNAQGDDFFKALYAGLVGKILRIFKPEIILVSAGFDGHVEDPMQGFQISTSAFGFLAGVLIQAADDISGKILFCLEGGYNPNALKESVRETLYRLQAKSLRHCPEPGSHTLVDDFRQFFKPYFPGI